MKLKFSKCASVTYEQAKARALAVLSDSPKAASSVADAIWPNHQMRRQGAGGAATRILRKMEDQHLVRWTCEEVGEFRCWGWVKL